MKDLLGRTIEVGDIVAISTSSRAHHKLLLGSVLGVIPIHRTRTWYKNGAWVEVAETLYKLKVNVVNGSFHDFSLGKYKWNPTTKSYGRQPYSGYTRTYNVQDNVVIVSRANEEKLDLSLKALELAARLKQENASTNT